MAISFVEMVVGTLEWLRSRWEVTLFSSIFLFSGWWFRANYGEVASRKALIEVLRNSYVSNTYKILVGSLIHISDKIFLSNEDLKRLFPARPAWTALLAERTVILALIYPTVFLYVQWVFQGAVLGIPGYEITAEGVPFATRAFSVFVFIVCIFLYFYRPVLSTRLVNCSISVILTYISCYLYFKGYVIIAVGAGTFFSIIIILFYAVVRGGSAQEVLSFYTAFMVSTSGALVASAIGFVTASYFVDVSYLQRIDRYSFPNEDLFQHVITEKINYLLQFVLMIWVITILVTLLCSIPLYVVIRKLARARRIPILVAALICTLLLFFVELDDLLFYITDDVSVKLIVLFPFAIYLGLLPAVNASFDFLSIGFTRWALRKGVKRIGFRTLGFSILDLCFTGVVLFSMFGVTVLFFGLAFPYEAHEESLVKNMLEGFREEPGDFIWLFGTFLSTAVPTLLHFMLAIWSVGPAVLRRKARHWLANELEGSSDHFGRRTAALMVLSAWTAFSISFPLISLAWLMEWAAPEMKRVAPLLIELLETIFLSLH